MQNVVFKFGKKDQIKRQIEKLILTHMDWEFLSFGPKDSNNQPTPPKNADFAIKAYGANCGEIKTDNLDNLRPKSWHWIKVNSNISKNDLIAKFRKLDYSISKNTTRQDSIGRGELVKLYEEYDE